ncbi:MAG: hypothetical protein R2862_08185 [Thermoanaerobaculia bacterium]
MLTRLIAAGIVAAGRWQCCLDDWLGDHDRRRRLLPPPLHELLDAVFWVSLDPRDPAARASWSPVGPSRAPAVTSTSRRRGAGRHTTCG